MGVSPERIARPQLRAARPEEADALAALGRETFIETFGPLYRAEDMAAYLATAYDAAAQREMLADPTLYNIVAEAGGQLVGYVKSGPCKLPVDISAERAYELHRLYVRASHQGQGLGDALIQTVFAEARRLNATALYLGMWEKNHKAYAFYQRYGFSEIGEYVFHVGTQADRELILRVPL